MSLPDHSRTSYDIIFVGGGTAACVTAGRLAEADPSLKILIVEAGPHTLNEPNHTQPARCFRCLINPTERFTFHVAKPSPALADRSAVVLTGRALGGGSSINCLLYTRAAASDYDDWENIYGNKGWGSEQLIPLLKKAETYQSVSTNSTHGNSGPIKVSFAEDLLNVSTDFLSAAGNFDKHRVSLDDTNAFHSCNGYGRWARYIDLETGRRSDTAHHYIYNQDHNTNLKILVRHRVVRVIFEGTRAVGIEYVDDTIGRAKGTTETWVARASRLVVISAGAFGTPSILERSGIGSKDVLTKNNIRQLVDLPGVGEHYMDHIATFLPFVVSENAETMDEIFWGTEEEIEPHVKKWLDDGKGPIACTGGECGIKLRPTQEELSSMSPEFDHIWNTYFANAPDKPVVVMIPIPSYVGHDRDVPRGKYFSVSYFCAYPVSLGRVHITAGLDPYGKLDFEPGYLDKPNEKIYAMPFVASQSQVILFFFLNHNLPSLSMARSSNSPAAPEEEEENATHEVQQVTVQLLYTVVEKSKDKGSKNNKKSTSKATKPKKKVESKKKEFSFVFEATKENYLQFLSTLLEKHGHKKLIPVTLRRRFTFKVVVPPNKAQKDAIDIDDYQEYEDAVKKIIDVAPTKVFITANLDDAKTSAARDDSGDESQSEDLSNDEKSDAGSVERRIAHNRRLLEKQYTNPHDSGYSFVGANGEKYPLTPAMMNEWSRAMTDGDVNKFEPPNTSAFDPAMRGRSLFQRPTKSATTDNTGVSTQPPPLAQASELLREVRMLINHTPRPALDPATVPSAESVHSVPAPLSPVVNTPSKLSRYLQHAETVLGVRDATSYEFSLVREGYGPDILPFVEEKDLVACGLSKGDAIRLKRGANAWWTSPEAKRTKAAGVAPSIANSFDDEHVDGKKVRFEKRYAGNSGCSTVFGSGLIEGFNRHYREFDWWYYNEVTRCLEKVPTGFVPSIHPDYLDPFADDNVPSPSPQRDT